jgi:branched-chain amino acid transport system ATP-binding protein
LPVAEENVIVDQHVWVALDIADRAYVLGHGRVVLQGAADDLSQRRDGLEESYL